MKTATIPVSVQYEYAYYTLEDTETEDTLGVYTSLDKATMAQHYLEQDDLYCERFKDGKYIIIKH